MNLIRTPRHWLPQLVDIVFTITAWLVFIWLLLGSIREIIIDERQGPRMELGVNALSGMDSLVLYLILSLLVATTIIIWSGYRRHQAGGYERRARVPNLSEEALSRNFGVDATLMKELQSCQLMTLHNDGEGNLHSVELPERMPRRGRVSRRSGAGRQYPVEPDTVK